MQRHFRTGVAAQRAGAPTSNDIRKFVQALLAKPVENASHLTSEMYAKPGGEPLPRPPLVSLDDPEYLPSLRRLGAEIAEAQKRLERVVDDLREQEKKWNSALHPRRGFPPNGGEFISTGGAGGSAGGAGGKPASFLDAVIKRNQQVADLTGVVTPGLMRSSRLAADLQSPGKIAGTVAGVLGTGGKAVVNGSVTAIKNVATLGLSSSQLELIGVTKEDRDRGYDQAVAIATASGEVLIAVGTSGLASVLSKGGTIARIASGALVAYDAADNAVGVVRGAYDAKKNGVNLSNGTQVAAGLLGLGANAAAIKGVQSAAIPKAVTTDASSGAFRGGFARVRPSELKFSQTSAGGGGRAAALRKSMASGWNGPPIDVVRTPGGLVTIDNTRVAVARELAMPEIPVNVRLPSDPLPDSMLGRFGDARTWGEALQHRTGSQTPRVPASGTAVPPRMPR